MAALNPASELGYLGNPAAWSLRALSDELRRGRGCGVLSAAQRKALIAAASPQADG